MKKPDRGFCLTDPSIPTAAPGSFAGLSPMRNDTPSAIPHSPEPSLFDSDSDIEPGANGPALQVAGEGGSGLEAALDAQERQVDHLLKQAAALLSSLKQWKKACQHGRLANLLKASGLAAERSAALVEPVKEAASAWRFDLPGYLQGGAWRDELSAVAATQCSLRVFEEAEMLISSPVVITAQPGRGILKIGNVNWPALRPSVVANELKRLREQTNTGNAQEFVDCLFAVTQRIDSSSNPFAKFRQIYDWFCLAPGYRRENSPAAFGQAIYSMERSGIRTTKSGKVFELETPSGNVKARDVFDVVAQDGTPLRYYGIRFFL